MARKASRKTAKTVSKTTKRVAKKAKTKRTAKKSATKRVGKKATTKRVAKGPAGSGGKTKRSTAGKSASKPRSDGRKPRSSASARPKLLSGGNPQIAKGDGDEFVQAYIAAMPGWKGDVGRRLDDLIERTVPGVVKAVRWNTPFYGVAGQGWFLGYHCITRYIKVSFFRGTSLRPVPPVTSKHREVRYFHIHEDDTIDQTLLTSWIEQAATLPGERCF